LEANETDDKQAFISSLFSQDRVLVFTALTEIAISDRFDVIYAGHGIVFI
jgi:hypothetical protein